MIRLNISERIREKLSMTHKVRVQEIEECFENRERKFLKDTREEHKTNPPTQWFISETNTGRKLKIVFMRCHDGSAEIKTAYDPDQIEERTYERKT